MTLLWRRIVTCSCLSKWHWLSYSDDSSDLCKQHILIIQYNNVTSNIVSAMMLFCFLFVGVDVSTANVVSNELNTNDLTPS